MLISKDILFKGELSMKHILFLIVIISCIPCHAAENGLTRKPLSPTAKETIGAVNSILHGALGMVQHKEDQEHHAEFASSLHELAHGFANLILAVKQHNKMRSHLTKEKIEELIRQFVYSIEEIISNV